MIHFSSKSELLYTVKLHSHGTELFPEVITVLVSLTQLPTCSCDGMTLVEFNFSPHEFPSVCRVRNKPISVIISPVRY